MNLSFVIIENSIKFLLSMINDIFKWNDISEFIKKKKKTKLLGDYLREMQFTYMIAKFPY